jgi:hypothetical protein
MSTKGGRAVLSELRLITLEPQGPIQRLANGRFVVDHQDSHPLQSGGCR